MAFWNVSKFPDKPGTKWAYLRTADAIIGKTRHESPAVPFLYGKQNLRLAKAPAGSSNAGGAAGGKKGETVDIPPPHARCEAADVGEGLSTLRTGRFGVGRRSMAPGTRRRREAGGMRGTPRRFAPAVTSG
ncbi:hypothetical protein [Burkholderia plantarii]|uniref:hypothetical protein n=1 Tax=Burkholderia plantarii TaxID=41899 RepID=UPI0018DBAF9C|nr:hypothetical protein [Burkholderia plantarii]MBI0330355.1 hypothetical protein [Burkholderia plantarii]